MGYQTCFKFGVKFGTQKVLKQFIEHGYPGTYLRVLEEGYVKKDDSLILVKKEKDSLTVHQLFKLIVSKTKDQDLLRMAINNKALPKPKRDKLKAYMK